MINAPDNELGSHLKSDSKAQVYQRHCNCMDPRVHFLAVHALIVRGPQYCHRQLNRTKVDPCGLGAKCVRPGPFPRFFLQPLEGNGRQLTLQLFCISTHVPFQMDEQVPHVSVIFSPKQSEFYIFEFDGGRPVRAQLLVCLFSACCACFQPSPEGKRCHPIHLLF